MRLLSLLLLVLTVAVVGFTITPTTLSYVTSDSMEPTIEKGDMYILNSETNPEPGDIITFESDHYGGAVTHRVIDTSSEGYITQGDANDRPDQAGAMPPVTEETIIGTVVTVGGEPVIVPDAMPIVEFIDENSLLIVAALLSALLLDGLLLTTQSERTRPQQLTYGDVFDVVFSVGVIVLVLLFWAGGATTSVPISDTDSVTKQASLDDHTIIHTNHSTNIHPGFHYTASANGATVVDSTTSDGMSQASVRLDRDSNTTTGTPSVTFGGYPMTLPPTIIDTLHSYHPVVASFGTVPLTLLPFYIIGHLFIPSYVPVRRSHFRIVQRWRH